MSYGYLVFQTLVPISSPGELSEESTIDFETAAGLRKQLSEAVPQIEWFKTHGMLTCEWGWIEFMFSEEKTIGRAFSIATSFRQDRESTEEFLRDLCNRFRWTVFDGQEVRVISWTE